MEDPQKPLTATLDAAQPTAVSPSRDVKPKVEAEVERLSPVPAEAAVDDSAGEALPDVKPVMPVDEKPDIALPPTPPDSTSSRSTGGPRPRKRSAPAFSVEVPVTRRHNAYRSPAPEVELDEKPTPPTKKPKATPNAKAAAKGKGKGKAKPLLPTTYLSQLSLGINPFDIASVNFKTPSPTELVELQRAGYFHNGDFPGPPVATSTLRTFEPYGSRLFIKSELNFGIDHAAPIPGQPCVVVCGMTRNAEGRWLDDNVAGLARQRLESQAPFGVVAAAAAQYSDSANRWRPLGRYTVKDLGAAPAGAFSQAPSSGRMEAVAMVRSYLRATKPDCIIDTVHLFHGAKSPEQLNTEAKMDGAAFDERLGRELDNLNQEQHLMYAILEYHSPYDPNELKEAMDERRTGVKKAAVKAARAATRARVAAETAAGTRVPKKKRGKKAAESEADESEVEDDSAEHSDLASDESEGDSEEDGDGSYEDE